MNFIAICLHCLDMRDFHSNLRDTPFLDTLRSRSIFIPMGRGQGHHVADSLVPELTGKWTARCSNSRLDQNGYHSPDKFQLPETAIESMRKAGYEIIPRIAFNARSGSGTYSVQGGMQKFWLKGEPHRLEQFAAEGIPGRKEWLQKIQNSKKFYAHIFLRETHRPWSQEKRLYGLLGLRSTVRRMIRKRRGLPCSWPHDAYCARRAALEKPDEFAALRRRGLAKADGIVAEIFEATKHIDNLTYIVYSNHGEVFDHFRYNQPYSHSRVDGLDMIEGTSHGNLPYETVYANMQIWIVPDLAPRVMRGTGRSIDLSPTLLDLADVKAPPRDGESMLDCFREGTFPRRDRYAETPLAGGCLSMVRKDGLKLIAVGAGKDGEDRDFAVRSFPGHRLAAFDLKCDPYEYVNLIDTPHGKELLEWAIRTHAELKPA